MRYMRKDFYKQVLSPSPHRFVRSSLEPRGGPTLRLRAQYQLIMQWMRHSSHLHRSQRKVARVAIRGISIGRMLQARTRLTFVFRSRNSTRAPMPLRRH
ncbi:unnamed protein product [Trichogramma brassicae]|uniref:Uncharacterized protein n=1 Tax=Trichogramma brassicae TaxID=86971 RepID=A0A6H5HY27_9HYME|nr:unnamed protein product [Trichogramma brassicae]